MFDDVLEAAEYYINAKRKLEAAKAGVEYPGEWRFSEADQVQDARECFEKAFRAAVEYCLNPVAK